MAFFFFFLAVVVALPDRGVVPRQHPGVLAQVEVQQTVGVLVAGAQSLRERHHSWAGCGRGGTKGEAR